MIAADKPYKTLAEFVAYAKKNPGKLASIELMQRLYGEHPYAQPSDGTAPSVAAINREQLLALLRGNEIDLAVMGRPPKGEYALRSEPFAGHPMVFVCPPGHPLLGVGHPPVDALVHHPLVVRELGSEVRHVLDNYLREHRLAPRIAMEIPSNETIKASVMAGLGIGFVSLHAVAAEVQSGQLHIVDFEDTPVMRTWNLVHEASKVLSPAAEAFRYLMLEHGEALINEPTGAMLHCNAS